MTSDNSFCSHASSCEDNMRETGGAFCANLTSPADDAALIDRLDSHMGKQDVSILLADCRKAAARLTALNAELSERIEEGERLRAALDRLCAKILDDDHKRGCGGRQYECTCEYDGDVWLFAQQARAALPTPSRGGR